MVRLGERLLRVWCWEVLIGMENGGRTHFSSYNYLTTSYNISGGVPRLRVAQPNRESSASPSRIAGQFLSVSPTLFQTMRIVKLGGGEGGFTRKQPDLLLGCVSIIRIGLNRSR